VPIVDRDDDPSREGHDVDVVSGPGVGDLTAVTIVLMPRLRLGGERNAFTVGVGASVGGFAQIALPCEGAADGYDARAVVLWRNAGAGAARPTHQDRHAFAAGMWRC